MMSFITIALLGYVILAVVSLCDKHIVSETPTSPRLYTFYSSIFFIFAFAALFFTSPMQTGDIAVSTFSGVTFAMAMWAMFYALRTGEATHVAPFIGALVAVCTYLLSQLFLNETLSPFQIIGLAFLVVSSLLFSFEKSKTHNGFHRGFLWATLSGLLFALSHVSAKYIYDLYPFITGLVWTKGTIGLVGVAILCLPSFWKEARAKKETSPTTNSTPVLKLVITSKILGIIGVLAIQYAIAQGSVTVVNGLAGIQYAVLFLLVLILTKLRPQIFEEYFTKKELYTEIFALLCAIIGLYFLA